MKNCLAIVFLINSSFLSAQTEIYFEFGKYTLTAQSKNVLDSFLIDVAESDELKIIGYTDFVGGSESNIVLSGKRAIAVKNYVIKYGESSKIETLAMGECNARYTENLKNRRVEIILLKGKVPKERNTIEFSQKLSIEQFIIGDQINLRNIQFDPGTANLYDQTGLDELRILRRILDRLSTLKIRIEGHVCCEDDYALSEKRAMKVLLYLTDNGIAKDRLSSVGFSNTKPLVPDTSAENNQKNRRVEIQITER